MQGSVSAVIHHQISDVQQEWRNSHTSILDKPDQC
jgi:hypothetical protein